MRELGGDRDADREVALIGLGLAAFEVAREEEQELLHGPAAPEHGRRSRGRRAPSSRSGAARRRCRSGTASWPLIGANVPMRPWRCSRSMRSSKRRPEQHAAVEALELVGRRCAGSSAESRLPSLSRMDRCSIGELRLEGPGMGPGSYSLVAGPFPRILVGRAESGYSLRHARPWFGCPPPPPISGRASTRWAWRWRSTTR